jgi:trimeric autotransporter adhesin
MRGVSYTKDGEASSGVIAQEIEKVAPELVHTAKDEMGTKSVAYGNLVGYLIEAIKDQQKEIEYMKSEIKTLKENK